MSQWPVDDIDEASAGEMHVSPRGEARREVMLRELDARLRRKVRRRKVVRTVSASAAALLVFAGAWVWFSRTPGPTMTAPSPELAFRPLEAAPHGEAPSPQDSGRTPNLAHPTPHNQRDSRLVLIRVVRNDPALAATITIAPSAPGIARISDSELRTALRAAGIDDGLIRLEGKLQLARDVLAPDPGKPQDGPQSRGAATAESVPST